MEIAHLGLRLVAESAQPVGQNWVGVIVGRVQPIGVHGAQVFCAHGNQGGSQLILVALLLGVCVCLVFVLSRQEVAEELHKTVDRGAHVAEKHKCNQWGPVGRESEGLEERFVGEERREQDKRDGNRELGEGHHLWQMVQSPVADLVGQHGYHLGHGALFNQCVVKQNLLAPGQADKHGV